jgi:hypothetical protein
MAVLAYTPQQLLTHLSREEQYYACLLQLQQDMQASLVHNRQSELEQVVHKQEQCLALMQPLQKEREQMYLAMGGDLNFILTQLTDLRMRTQIKALQQKINTHIAGLLQLRVSNQALLEQSMHYVQHTTELYRSLASASAPAVYSPYGQIETPRPDTHTSFCEYNA